MEDERQYIITATYAFLWENSFFFFLCGRKCGGRWKNTWKFKHDTLNIEKIISLELLLISI